jgi:hypothetical protein
MSLRVYCPDCNARHTLPDHSAGRRVRCRRCGRPIRVGARNERGDREEYEPDIDPARHRTITWVVVGGVLLMFGLVMCAGLAVWYVQVNRPCPAVAPNPDPDDERFGGPERDDWD